MSPLQLSRSLSRLRGRDGSRDSRIRSKLLIVHVFIPDVTAATDS